ncbi:MAG: S53 family peptidase [Syntrophobacteraceae bacterium]
MMKRSLVASLVLSAAFLTCLATGWECFAASVGTANQNSRVVLSGAVNPKARPEFDQGPSDPSTQMNGMILLLKMDPQKQEKLDQLIAQQQDSSSANFHKWLTPAEFGRRFGRSPEEIARVKNWLLSQGLRIESVSNSHTMINFSGTAAALNNAFQAHMHDYNVNGRLHHANSVDPSIPGDIADLVAGPTSLSDFHRKPAHTAARPVYTSGSGYALSPGDFATVYDVNKIYNSLGYNGKGVTIAITGQAPADTQMWQEFRTTFGLPSTTIKVLVAGNRNQTPFDNGNGDQEETDLDVEWAGAVAPGATIDFVTASVNDGGIDTANQYVVDQTLAPILSCSYDSCELNMGNPNLYTTLWKQAAAEGITVFVASGDSGAYDCTDSSGNPIEGVNGMASTPYNVAVGGTSLSDSSQYWSSTNSATGVSALSSIPELPEVAWNDFIVTGYQNQEASGGGASSYYSKPSWQVCPGVPNDGRRDLPDVSLNADPDGVGYLVYTCDDDSSACTSRSYYGQYVLGGTSCAAPAFAGIMALIEQSLGSQWQGNANTSFYQLGQAQYGASGSATTVFNDITSGTNGFVGSGTDLPGYSCTIGYDRVTGLGSVDATNFLLAYQQAAGLWAGAVDLGNGWRYLSWFGYFNTSQSPWVYHNSLGWLYPIGTSPDNIWFWDPQVNSFLWTSQTDFPFLYSVGYGAWLYYEEWTSNPGEFYNFGTNSWISD